MAWEKKYAIQRKQKYVIGPFEQVNTINIKSFYL